jgi:hypothetical protein
VRLTDASSNYIWECWAPVSQAAGLTEIYEAYPGASWQSLDIGSNPPIVNMLPLPANLVAEPGWILTTVVVDLQVGDTFPFANVVLGG